MIRGVVVVVLAIAAFGATVHAERIVKLVPAKLVPSIAGGIRG